MIGTRVEKLDHRSRVQVFTGVCRLVRRKYLPTTLPSHVLSCCCTHRKRHFNQLRPGLVIDYAGSRYYSNFPHIRRQSTVFRTPLTLRLPKLHEESGLYLNILLNICEDSNSVKFVNGCHTADGQPAGQNQRRRGVFTTCRSRRQTRAMHAWHPGACRALVIHDSAVDGHDNKHSSS